MRTGRDDTVRACFDPVDHLRPLILDAGDDSFSREGERRENAAVGQAIAEGPHGANVQDGRLCHIGGKIPEVMKQPTLTGFKGVNAAITLRSASIGQTVRESELHGHSIAQDVLA
jgi:hypothetical protein